MTYTRAELWAIKLIITDIVKTALHKMNHTIVSMHVFIKVSRNM